MKTVTKIACVFFALSLSNKAESQLLYSFDTLTYESRINSSIDSVDVSGSFLPTTFDGGRSILSLDGLSTKRLFQDYTEFTFIRFERFGGMEFSALPHLGFSYSFGGQGSQFLRAKYNHAFTDNTLLQLNYSRDVGTGVLRNSAFTNNNVRLQFQHRGQVYSTRLKSSFVSYLLGHPGGIVEDSVDTGVDLSLYNVWKSDAASRNRIGQVDWSNYLNFLSDTTRALGIVLNHNYRVLNREYTEFSDTLGQIYDTLYIDTFSTRDQYNEAGISNGGGIYFLSPKLYAEVTADYDYWEFQNLGSKWDSSELDLNGFVRLSIKDIQLQNRFNFNLLGRFNEFSERFIVQYDNPQISAVGQFIYEQKAPVPLQRRYFANEVNYYKTNIELQQWFRAELSAEYRTKDKKIIAGLKGDYTSISNLYYFDGSEWITDSLSTNMLSVSAYSAMAFGIFNFQPRFVFSADDKNYLPAAQVYSRLFVKGKLFKAKKLEALVGVDVSYITEFKTRTFIPYMNTYDWTSNSVSFEPMINLHAFLSMRIADFRFFFRYENIGRFWSNINNEVSEHYPISQPRMRLGITWDFFKR